MKVAVIGAGALGSMFGGLLAADGNDVWLLHHRAGYAAALDERGVSIEGADGDTRRIDVRSTVDASAVGPVDLAMVLVKSHQTVAAVTQHEACIGPATRVLSLQNGLTNHYRLREHVGAERTLHGVTYQGAESDGPGQVRRTATGPSIFGGHDAGFANRVAEVFESAGVEARVIEEPFEHVWRKLLWSVAIKPVAALTGLPNGELVADEGLSEVMYRLMAEAATVADARGVELDVDATFETLTSALEDSTHTSSMLQDVLGARKTEVGDVNGAVVALGNDEGIDVPYNEMATALVEGLERGYGGEDGLPDADDQTDGNGRHQEET